jgi:hypothetical protein
MGWYGGCWTYLENLPNWLEGAFNALLSDRMGNIIGVAYRFGGIEELVGAMGDLGRRIY